MLGGESEARNLSGWKKLEVSDFQTLAPNAPLCNISSGKTSAPISFMAPDVGSQYFHSPRFQGRGRELAKKWNALPEAEKADYKMRHIYLVEQQAEELRQWLEKVLMRRVLEFLRIVCFEFITEFTASERGIHLTEFVLFETFIFQAPKDSIEEMELLKEMKRMKRMQINTPKKVWAMMADLEKLEIEIGNEGKI